MDWRWTMIVLLVVLVVIVSAPLWASLIWGRSAMCGAAGTPQCLRDWISSLSGPLAIIAAIIAACAVWDQLEENRAATRLAMASVIRLEEQTIEGVMAALRQEDTLVEGSKRVPESVIKLIYNIQNNQNNQTIAEEQFTRLRDTSDEDISEARMVAQEMDSKSDKDTVIPSRKTVEATFNRFINAVEDVKKYGNLKEGGGLYGQFSLLHDICVQITASIDNYNAEFLELNQNKAKERDELERKRKAIAESVALYK